MNTTLSKSISSFGWREPILKHFTPEIAMATRLTIVADPDLLFAEKEILSELQARGFDMIPFADHIAFRFAYESRYRQVWDRGEKTNLVVVLRSPSESLDVLPHDLLEQARYHERSLSFSVAELFPKLVPNVVLGLERSCFDTLYKAQSENNSSRLGVDATKDFILRHVFEIAPELIKTPANLMQVLLRRHYRGVSFPAELDERFIHLLNKGNRWKEWPLTEIVPNRIAFLAFLEERWPNFIRLSIASKGNNIKEPLVQEKMVFNGPSDLPFGHDDVKVYIDDLFLEGQLNPTMSYSADQMPEAWMCVGVAASNGGNQSIRFERLLSRLEIELPNLDADHRKWVEYAQVWAEWTALRWELVDSGATIPKDACEELHNRIESNFETWMILNFSSLHNLSPFHRPAMVHHIPQHMAHSFTVSGAQGVETGLPSKHALIVIDGLAFDQWVILRDSVRDQNLENFQFEEDGSFAWVPTLTGVSRQAIFAGREPLFFESSLGNTSKEKNQWSRFWEERGAKRIEIGYVREGKDQSDENFHSEIIKIAEHPKMRLLGIVLGKIDQSMHGIKTGTGGLHAIVRQWANTGTLTKLINGLLDLSFEIIITSDHGNIQGIGIGKPQVGVIADERGERVHIFNDENTRAEIAKQFPDTIIWPQIGLPESWRALLASKRGAFIPKGNNTVGHGGISMEEVIVPFVKIKRSTL